MVRNVDLLNSNKDVLNPQTNTDKVSYTKDSTTVTLTQKLESMPYLDETGKIPSSMLPPKEGELIYLGVINLNTKDVTQQALNDRAAELGYTTLLTGYVLVDLNTNDWWYNATDSQWVNIGFTSVEVATNTTLGIVKGSTAYLKVQIDDEGVMTVTQLSDIIDTINTSLSDKLETSNLIAGANITLETSGNDITVSSSGGSGSGILVYAADIEAVANETYVVYYNTLYRCAVNHTTTIVFNRANWVPVSMQVRVYANMLQLFENQDFVIYNNELYMCISSHTTTSTFDPTKFEKIGGTLEDAPSDGNFYGRNNAGWVTGYSKTNIDTLLATKANTSALETKVDEAPEDGKQYVRKDKAWEEVKISTTTKYNLSYTFPDTSNIIPLGLTLDDSAMIDYVNVGRTQLLPSDWDLSPDKQNIILKVTMDVGDQAVVSMYLGSDIVIPDGIEEAPNNGKQYVRKDKGWYEIEGGTGGGTVPYYINYTAVGGENLIPLGRVFGANDYIVSVNRDNTLSLKSTYDFNASRDSLILTQTGDTLHTREEVEILYVKNLDLTPLDIPIASNTILGGVRIPENSGLVVDSNNGDLSVAFEEPSILYQKIIDITQDIIVNNQGGAGTLYQNVTLKLDPKCNYYKIDASYYKSQVDYSNNINMQLYIAVDYSEVDLSQIFTWELTIDLRNVDLSRGVALTTTESNYSYLPIIWANDSQPDVSDNKVQTWAIRGYIYGNGTQPNFIANQEFKWDIASKSINMTIQNYSSKNISSGDLTLMFNGEDISDTIPYANLVANYGRVYVPLNLISPEPFTLSLVSNNPSVVLAYPYEIRGTYQDFGMGTYEVYLQDA